MRKVLHSQGPKEAFVGGIFLLICLSLALSCLVKWKTTRETWVSERPSMLLRKYTPLHIWDTLTLHAFHCLPETQILLGILYFSMPNLTMPSGLQAAHCLPSESPTIPILSGRAEPQVCSESCLLYLVPLRNVFLKAVDSTNNNSSFCNTLLIIWDMS